MLPPGFGRVAESYLVTEPEVMGREAERSDWLDHLVRAGLIAYGLVFLLLAWMAVQLALGQQSEDASPKGALNELAQQPFGRVLVWAVAVGMLLLVVWRLLEAAFGHRERDGAERGRMRVYSIGRSLVYGAIGAVAVQVGVGSGSRSSSSSSRGMTAKLMDLPGGQWLVAGLGLAVIGYGVGVAWGGWRETFAKHLQTEGKLGYSGAAYLLLGKVGYVAKGVVIALVGVFLAYAGITHEPQKSGGLDQALQKVLQQPFGPAVLIAVGAGIACYGVFALVRARHLDR